MDKAPKAAKAPDLLDGTSLGDDPAKLLGDDKDLLLTTESKDLPAGDALTLPNLNATDAPAAAAPKVEQAVQKAMPMVEKATAKAQAMPAAASASAPTVAKLSSTRGSNFGFSAW